MCVPSSPSPPSILTPFPPFTFTIFREGERPVSQIRPPPVLVKTLDFILDSILDSDHPDFLPKGVPDSRFNFGEHPKPRAQWMEDIHPFLCSPGSGALRAIKVVRSTHPALSSFFFSSSSDKPFAHTLSPRLLTPPLLPFTLAPPPPLAGTRPAGVW